MEEIRQRRLLMVPAPFEGHFPSMMNLASYLFSQGISVTVVQTQFNFKDLSASFPDLNFFTIKDGMSESDMKSLGLLEFILRLNSICEPILKELLIINDDVDFIIYDEFVYFPRGVAEDLHLPNMIFSPSSAATSISRCVLMDNQSKGLLPPQEAISQLEEMVPEFHPFRFKDLPVTAYGSMERLMILYENVSNRSPSSGIIHNSSNCLESSFISTAQENWRVPVYPVGPLHMTNPATSCPSLFDEERNCLEWLEKQETNSVIYISMGSLAMTQEIEALEMAIGFVESNQPFLWVIRPGSIIGQESLDFLPEQFRQTVTDGRGFVVQWAPQKEVLRHRAVGGFWNHCGWNSCLESISSGVPMICMPYSGDQKVNARLMSHVWQTAFEIEGKLERGIVERAVRRLTVDHEGVEMRMRAIRLKEEIEASVRIGGSSRSSLNSLVDRIMSLTSLRSPPSHNIK
ncbi:PREDICTED: UDP-glycosyltransferase 76D1-like [Camelina sativa]|uniref:UDP-glycosyltransferase 76D1-like n=1 Tax=Camelina sativa TaxID=90675 RepID=A0ABM0SX82_CAMSA|nr:PREDICTED: UDP-glycosyltransferase 76D1-like [Camelina sativa]